MEAELAERYDQGRCERLWRDLEEEDRKAEDKSNGTAGATNQYVATLPGVRL
jgi:hypothetical protein